MKILFNPDFGIRNVFSMQNSTAAKPITNSIIEPIEDKVTFTGNIENHKINVDPKTAEFVANSLSTSTSGHRAKYGSDKFNPEIVELLTLGVAKYANEKAEEKNEPPFVIIGGDTRKATRESLPLINDTLVKQGISVMYIKDPVPTPLLAQMTKTLGNPVSILLTASHNPWEDGGFNLVTNDGAIAPPSVTKQIAENAVNYAKQGYYTTDKTKQGSSAIVYPYNLYKEKIDSKKMVDWENIRYANISIFYDSMQGTGDYVFPELLRDNGIKYTVIDSDKKEGPNPTDKNLSELKRWVRDDRKRLKIGLANDGDADRFGVVDENGNFVSPNDVILLVAHHLANNKGIKGDIIRSQATSSEIDLFAQKNGLNVIQTPVGFKYIGEDILKEREEGKDILVAGEESGGLTINGHIPEKDGIIALLMILDMMAKENKPLSQILKEVKKASGVEFRAYNFSKTLEDEQAKATIMKKMNGIYQDALRGDTKFGDFEIDVEKTKANMEEMEKYKQGGDGVKLYMTDGSSVLVRKSGTEPKVKAYIETFNEDENIADENVEKLKTELERIFDTTGNVSFRGLQPANDVSIKTPDINFSEYEANASEAVSDITSRIGKEGQFLNWINKLPNNQLQNLDNIYEMAQQAKEGGFEDLAIIGIGGSRHTTEAMVKMLGKDKNVHFYSSIDPESFERFKDGLDLDKTKFLVVSKSGGTLETTTAYNAFRNVVQKHLGKEDVSDRFIAMTDASAEKSKLRREVENGEIQLSGLVHDDVGGRFSIFDDATLFTLAYIGVAKEDVEKMLIASINAQKEFLNPDIYQNEALQLAAFNVDSKLKGKNKHFNEYFSDAFNGATLWDKQLNNESLKAQISTDTNVGPGYLHYNAEADLDENNNDSFYTFIYPKTDDRVTNAVLKGVTTAYKAQHPVSEIVLDNLSPEAIARFIELKHFETLYTGNMLRRTEGGETPNNEALPEVLQPNVEKYKKEVKANL